MYRIEIRPDTTPDRFSWSPLKYHAVRFTAVHSQTFRVYFERGRSIDLEIEGSLADGLSFPQVRCQNIGDSR